MVSEGHLVYPRSLAISFSLRACQPHWPPCCFLNKPGLVSPQGFCTCCIFCLNSLSSVICIAHSLTFFRFFSQKSFHRTFLITPFKSMSLSSISYPTSLLYFSIILNIIKYFTCLLAVFLCMNVNSLDTEIFVGSITRFTALAHSMSIQ